MRAPATLALVALLSLAAQRGSAQAGGSANDSSAATDASARVLLPRYVVTASLGGFAVAGRPYAFVEPYFRSLRFDGGPLLRVDGTARIAGPLSARLGVAYAVPRWEAAGQTCECGTYKDAQGMHSIGLTFVDVGARAALLRSDSWPPDQLYLEVSGGAVHQHVQGLKGGSIPSSDGTVGTIGFALGGSYSLRDRVAFSVQVEDKLARYLPADLVAIRRKTSNSIFLTVGIGAQLF